MLAGLAVVQTAHVVEARLGLQAEFNADSARAVLGTLAASMFTFVVFVCSALLVAVQLASAQLTPRIIGIVFRDPVTRLSLTLFVFAFSVSLAALVRISDAVPLLTGRLAVYSCLASMGVFLYLIDHVGRVLRPSGALRIVGRLGCGVIENVYPRLLGEGQESLGASGERAKREGTSTVMVRSPSDGTVLAFDIAGLVALARKADCVIELVPQVGGFVAVGDPLFRVFGSAAPPVGSLCESVAIGMERTVEQDPAFAFRILVDIANKGLSPAINDPTTAVLVIDQIQHLLSTVGRRRLDDGRVSDAAGKLRLIYRTPNWDDFVHLAVTEIRQFGAGSIQVMRRLRAMLEKLVATLPPTRLDLLQKELSVLQRLTERTFLEPEDRALAGMSDAQGVGGAPE
jgi:uncharacterized membrane protein